MENTAIISYLCATIDSCKETQWPLFSVSFENKEHLCTYKKTCGSVLYNQDSNVYVLIIMYVVMCTYLQYTAYTCMSKPAA